MVNSPIPDRAKRLAALLTRVQMGYKKEQQYVEDV